MCKKLETGLRKRGGGEGGRVFLHKWQAGKCAPLRSRGGSTGKFSGKEGVLSSKKVAGEKAKKKTAGKRGGRGERAVFSRVKKGRSSSRRRETPPN